MLRIVILAFTLASSGCALMASSLAHHNSRGTACVDSPAFAVIDIVIAAAAAGGAAAEDSTGGYVVAGVFGASGTIGLVSAISCQEDNDGNGSDYEAPPASNTAPSFGEAPVDPDAREATREEWGIAPIEPVAPATPTTLELRLGRDVELDLPPATSEKTEKRSCRDAPSSCAPGETCAIAGDDAGYCVPDPSR